MAAPSSSSCLRSHWRRLSPCYSRLSHIQICGCGRQLLKRLWFCHACPLLILHLFTLLEASCHVVSCPMQRPMKQGTEGGLGPTASKEQISSVPQPVKNWILLRTMGVSLGVNPLSVEPSNEPAAPANTLPEASWETLSQKTPLSPSRFLTHRNGEVLNGFYFKLLNFGVIHYTVIDN